MSDTTPIVLNQAELAVRLIEAAYKLERPHPDPAVVLANMLTPPHGMSSEEAAAGWLRAADAALTYFQECLGSNVKGVIRAAPHPTAQ